MATILNAYSLSGGDTTSSTYTSLGECVTLEATTTNINGVNSLIKIQSSDDEISWSDIGQIILGVGSDLYCNDPVKVTGLYVRCLLITNDSTSGTITVTASNGSAGTGDLLSTNNLSDVADEATSLYNIAKIKSGKFSLDTNDLFNLESSPYSLASVFPAVAGHFWVGISCVMDYTFNTVEFDNRINIGASTCLAGGGIWQFSMSGYAADVIGAATIIQVADPDCYVVNDFLHIGSTDVATTGDGSAIFYITAMLVEA